MKMKLPPDVLFHYDLHLLVYRPRGIMTDKRLDQLIETLEREENKAVQPFNRFTDLSKLDAIDVHFQTVFRFSLHRRLFYKDRPAVKSAIYVTSEAAARIVKIHAVLTDCSPLKVRIFDDLSAAAKWLGVTVEDLQIGM
jgi:hypothetical protein